MEHLLRNQPVWEIVDMATAISCCHGDVITALVSTLYLSNSQTDFDVQHYIVFIFREQNVDFSNLFFPILPTVLKKILTKSEHMVLQLDNLKLVMHWSKVKVFLSQH